MSSHHDDPDPSIESLDDEEPSIAGSVEPGPADEHHDQSDPDAALKRSGVLAWMANNSVAANLLMIVLVVGGLLMLSNIKQEVFPEFSLDMVTVNVAYPGASPAEVEQGVLLAIEEAVRDVDGVKKVTATAQEGVGAVTIELLLGTNPDRALADVKSSVDRITSFPQDIERPIVSLVQSRHEVISLLVYGDKDEATLRGVAERVRDDLLASDEITVVDLAAVRPYEISVEVPQETLRRYGLTLGQIAARISQASVELPGGGVKTAGGEILVRTTERRDRGNEFAEIGILSRPDGSEIKLGDIATIDDGFADTDQEARYDGKPAAMVKVYRVGDQTPTAVASVVHQYVAEQKDKLPEGVAIGQWLDWSQIYQDRVNLLMTNGAFGLVLVMIVLGLFLELRLAFWVTLGIPVSFTGALLFLPAVDASINMISLFAFIITLGIVVDDAIVVGEAVYKRRQSGVSYYRAAVEGVREVGVPVIFAVVTTLMAFAPLMFVPGIMGKFFWVVPVVVIAVLSVSLVESLLILPAHLSHRGGVLLTLLIFDAALLLLGPPSFALRVLLVVVGVACLVGLVLLPAGDAEERGPMGLIHRQQQRFSRGVEWFVEHVFTPVVRRAIDRRYLTLSIAVAMLLAAAGLRVGNRVKFTFMPKVEGDVVSASLEMPFGTAVADTSAEMGRMMDIAREILDEWGGRDTVARGTFAVVGQSGVVQSSHRGGATSSGGHIAEAAVYLVPVDDRPFTGEDFAREWRKRTGEIAGAESLKFNFNTGPQAGSPIDIQLSHTDIGVLELAAQKVAAGLREYETAGVYNIDDGFAPGKEQLDLELRPEARSLGVTELDLARQIRSSFYGAEAVRQQRGRDEVRTFVRLPDGERRSEYDIETLLIRTPGGGEMPLEQAAEVHRGRSYTQITRADGRRVVNVTADIDETKGNAGEVIKAVEANVLPDVLDQFHGLSYTLSGEQEAQAEAMGNLGFGFLMALIAIYALLAVAFRSYVQPAIIMIVIPFGFVGAVLGHVAMGYTLSLMSLMGVVALAGVVVNDSLILIVAANQYRGEGMTPFDAMVAAGARRFRPILLTSLTTFFGLAPMILETSVQAKFLIPMAISLGFGVLFATFITLLLVPAVYAIVEDLKTGLGWAVTAVKGTPPPTPAE